jgi:hypothetical protein
MMYSMKRRPLPFDPAVTRAAAEALTDDIVRYRSGPREEILQALVLAMDVDDEADVIQANLVNAGWELDAEQRNVISRAPHERRQALRAAVEQWIETSQISPAFALGQRIRGPVGAPPVVVAGLIGYVDLKHARYAVTLPTGREVLMNFEDARAAAEH